MALCPETQRLNTRKAITDWAFRLQIPQEGGAVSLDSKEAKALVFALRSGAAAMLSVVLCVVMALVL